MSNFPYGIHEAKGLRKNTDYIIRNKKKEQEKILFGKGMKIVHNKIGK